MFLFFKKKQNNSESKITFILAEIKSVFKISLKGQIKFDYTYVYVLLPYLNT